MTGVFLSFWLIGLLISLHEQRKRRDSNRRMFPSMQQETVTIWPLLFCTVLGAAVVVAANLIAKHH